MIIKIIFFIVLASFLQLNTYSQHDTIRINDDIQLIEISESIFVHVTYTNSEKFGRFSSNGLVLIKDGKALLIDTPMGTNPTKTLSNYIENSLGATIDKVIVGHYHDDCLAGLPFLHEKGVESVGGELTKNICIEKDLPIPKKSFADSLKLNFFGEQVCCYYFGGGHTVDNIVVYFPKYSILFGGCLIKSVQSGGLGNTADAVVDQWFGTVAKIKTNISNIALVIPGHRPVWRKRIVKPYTGTGFTKWA